MVPIPPTRNPLRFLGSRCQAADPPVQLSVPMRICGRTDDLRVEVHFGTYYRICRRHYDPEAVVVQETS